MAALALVGMLGPLGTDAALPALPGIALDLGVPESSVRLIISAYTIGLALGQLVIGALSDRIGRRRLMNWGALAAAVAAYAASAAPTLGTLIAACAALGVSSAAGLVTGRAIVSDTSIGRRAARRFTILQLAVGLGPILGPLAGAALLTVADWRSIFLSLAAVAVVGTLATMLFVPETLPPEHRRRESPTQLIRTMARILATRGFVTFAASIWLGFGTLFAYISTSPSILQSTYGQSSGGFALAFAVNGGGLVLSGVAAAVLVRWIAPARLVIAGLSAQTAAVLGLGILTLTGTATLPAVLVAQFVIAASLGLVFGPATSLAVAPVRDAAGTALALLGSFQFLAAGVAATLTVVVSPDPLVAFVIVGAISSLLALALSLLGARTLRLPGHQRTGSESA
jgi:DHA1 family bicyclomycin/chloramphenicol resistance-like MFS transporter